MQAEFNYTIEEVKKALLIHHGQKIHFSTNNYDSQVFIDCSEEDEPVFIIQVNEIIKPKTDYCFKSYFKAISNFLTIGGTK